MGGIALKRLTHVGIDPSLSNTGIAVITYTMTDGAVSINNLETRTYSTTPGGGVTIEDRVNALRGVILKDMPDDSTVSIEGLSYGSQGRAVTGLSALNYGIRGALSERSITYCVVPPTVAKKFATGKGNASKDSMVEAFTGMGGVFYRDGRNVTCDEVDAVFIGLAGLAWLTDITGGSNWMKIEPCHMTGAHVRATGWLAHDFL